MSRRRGEFEHRTSIFEGAYRAWSHLGGIDPKILETTPVSDLDPLSNPLTEDPRIRSSKYVPNNIQGTANPDGTPRRVHPYEPLPRSGINHPYVQAILSPWLGPDADNEAIELGLTTLRTWWQHRRKGESGSAIAALGTEKMNGVVEGYTRHFFTLAHCLVVNDREQPPRTLMMKMKAIEKQLKKQRKIPANKAKSSVGSSSMDGSEEQHTSTNADNNSMNEDADDGPDDGLTPLERLHASQQRHVREAGTIHPSIPVSMIGYSEPMSQYQSNIQQPFVDLRAKCNPNKIDLPGIVAQVSKQANQLAHRGNAQLSNQTGNGIPSHLNARIEQSAGSSNTYPLVFTSTSGDHLVALTMDGITCAHCVKIVETVLKGCSVNRSPIDGLLDAAADERLNGMIIKIDQPENAKRIVFEAARNLSMVGYTAKAKDVSLEALDRNSAMEITLAAFRAAALTDPQEIFLWSAPCSCPDNGVLRENCSRHSQFSLPVFEAFQKRAVHVIQYMMQHSSSPSASTLSQTQLTTGQQGAPYIQFYGTYQSKQIVQQPLPSYQQLAPTDTQREGNTKIPYDMSQSGASLPNDFSNDNQMAIPGANPMLRHKSNTSQGTFGRAMSGLSALSIDWENLEDFDIDIDFSDHIQGSDAYGSVTRLSPRAHDDMQYR